VSINSNEVQPCLGAPGPRSGSERVVLSFPADRGLTELSGGVIEPTCGPRWGAAQVPGLDPLRFCPTSTVRLAAVFHLPQGVEGVADEHNLFPHTLIVGIDNQIGRRRH
jgi:hypothetical protein